MRVIQQSNDILDIIFDMVNSSRSPSKENTHYVLVFNVPGR